MSNERYEKCEVCGKSANEPGPLYRKNAKGQQAIWRCNPCFDVVAPTTCIKRNREE